MKRLLKGTLTLTLMLIILVLITTNVYAANGPSFNVALTGDKTAKQGSDIKITISVKDLVDIGGSANAIVDVSGMIQYDETKLEVDKAKSAEGLNGFDTLWGTILDINNPNGVTTNNAGIATITFHVKENAALGDTTITFSGIAGSNGTTDILTTDAKHTITITRSNRW